MRTKLIAAAVVGLLLGLTAAFFWRQPDVQAQQPQKGTAYEYKVVEFGNGANNNETTDDMTKKLNKLSDEGWEYVGPVANATENQRFLQGYVAFRRAKK